MLKGLYQNLLKNRICPNRLIFLQGVIDLFIINQFYVDISKVYICLSRSIISVCNFVDYNVHNGFGL